MKAIRRVLLSTILCLLAGGLLSPPSVRAGEARWSFELFGGGSVSLPSHLSIRQSGRPDIELTARYESRPFESPFYYAWRIGRWDRARAWEIELIHDKIFLENRPAEVEAFSISHGYNLLTVNRAWERRGFVLRVGAGVVIAHPESTIRGATHSEDGGIFGRGYYVAGPTAQGAAGKRFRIGERFFLAGEGKITASWAHVPVAGGRADVPRMALHGLLGLGFEY